MKRILLLGVGNFGCSWANDVLPKCSGFAELVAIADRNKETHKRIIADVPKFTDLDEAIRKTNPDLVINVTPPKLHTALNKKLLEMKLAVLCEKPIAETVEQAKEMLDYLSANGGFLMIGENYRYHAVFREARKILKEGRLGRIHAAECHFRHYHPDYSAFYHGSLKHPLLTDVTVHHLDVARYLTGENPLTVSATEWAAPYAWYGSRPANVSLFSTMTNDVVFNYFGTLASPVSTTDWNADWEIECDRGVVKISSGRLFILNENGSSEIRVDPDIDSRAEMLREAVSALENGRRGETDISDNLFSYLWMASAIKSSEEEKPVEILKL